MSGDRSESSKGVFPSLTCLKGGASCWLQPQLGPVGPKPMCSFSWLLGFLIAWMAGFQEKKKIQQKQALESRNVTSTVCKPTGFREKHKPTS